MLELFPEGFAELSGAEATELVAFTDEAGAERLRARFDDVRVEAVPDGWETEWMRFHRPVEVGSLWIGPPWEKPTPGLVPVVIDPGLAFGTGAHPTTQLCLELHPASRALEPPRHRLGLGSARDRRVQARLRARRGD